MNNTKNTTQTQRTRDLVFELFDRAGTMAQQPFEDNQNEAHLRLDLARCDCGQADGEGEGTLYVPCWFEDGGVAVVIIGSREGIGVVRMHVYPQMADPLRAVIGGLLGSWHTETAFVTDQERQP